MFSRLWDLLVPSRSVAGIGTEQEEARVWAVAAQKRADEGVVRDDTARMVERARLLNKDGSPLVLKQRGYLSNGTTTTLAAIPCTCSPRHDPPHFVDPNCYACKTGSEAVGVTTWQYGG